MTAMVRKQQNKRLSNANRCTLRAFSQKLVEKSEPTTAGDRLQSIAQRLIIAAMIKEWPPSDMKVLEKYGLTKEGLDHINLSIGDGDFQQFNFIGEGPFPARPKARDRHGMSVPIMINEKINEAVKAFNDEVSARNERIEVRYSDYKALISSVSNFNDIAAVWPEAEELREAIVGSGTALVILNDDIIARIREDSAKRLEEAK